MVDLLTSRTIKLHQTLHGYADGHRMLGASVELKARDSKLMLSLSDASGSSSGTDAAGYLTGYPLAEGGFYALAKTWPAPEMPRPGCVWTHTLLVRFEDLATIPDLAILVNEFCRPDQAKPFESYKNSLQLDCEPRTLNSALPVRTVVARRFLSALYANPRDKVVSSEGGTEFREALCLALWSQQWPRLRRSFRFCTLVFADRSTDTFSFDLQFSPTNDRAVRGRFNKMIDADREASEPTAWLDIALSDLASGTEAPLRPFLRSLGAELSGGRELFAPFCQMYSAVGRHGPGDPDPVAAVALLEGPLAGVEAPSLRAAVVEAVAKCPGTDEHELSFAFRNFNAVPVEQREATGRTLGIATWQRRPSLLGHLLERDGELRTMVGEAALRALLVEDLLAGLRAEISLLPQVLRLRPEIVQAPELWALGEGASRIALEYLLRDPGGLANVLNALIELLPTDLIDRVCHAAGASAVLAALTDRWDNQNSTELLPREIPWLEAVAGPTSIAYLLSQGRPRRKGTLLLIASRFSPDDIPNDFGQDPWLTGLDGARGQLSQSDDLFLKTWTLARALGWRSRNQAELIKFSFEDVYAAVLNSLLPEPAWALLDQRLVDSRFWGSWDRGRRVRVGVATAFVDRELDAYIFGSLTTHDGIFEQLVSEVSALFWGRGYLKQVRRALKGTSEARWTSRIHLLNGFL